MNTTLSSAQRMSEARRVAESQPDNDPGEAIGTCPITRSDLQLVPARYAIVEPPEAQRAQAFPEFAPRYDGSFRPSGIRPIRSGWLYLVHSLSPEDVQVFKVEPDGSGDPIIVKREGSMQVLYSPLELSPLHVSMLRQAAFRSHVMMQVNIGAYCPSNGTAHLLDPDSLGEALADAHGEHQTMPDAPDRATDDTALETGRYGWCDIESQPPEWQMTTAPGIKAGIAAAYRDDSAILIVEDIPGRIKDLT